LQDEDLRASMELSHVEKLMTDLINHSTALAWGVKLWTGSKGNSPLCRFLAGHRRGAIREVELGIDSTSLECIYYPLAWNRVACPVTRELVDTLSPVSGMSRLLRGSAR
jgi:hypothetical protein